ncbi:MAG: branched-chain amino acid ABC transporter permease [Burkholderiaceae bacterium]|nr:branched-chain amino acid ABC transporter permease [Burkholderiaceae bacterium]
MSFQLLSNELPRSRRLSWALVAIVLLLALAPFLFPGARAINAAATICIFVVLTASYDLLLGYTGIISFAHTMFYGVGAYGVGLALLHRGPSFSSVLIGLGAAMLVSLALALLIGLFSLRVQAIFYAMVTLAIASCVSVMTSQFPEWTGGDDGLTIPVPELLSPAFRLLEEPFFGKVINGKVLTYYLLFVVALLAFLLMLRIVASPFGRVLQAIRENEFRAEAIGYHTAAYRTLGSVLGALGATLAGAMLVLWLRYLGPDTTLSFAIMLNVLLITFIGGRGTLYGAVLGSALYIVAQTYLIDLMKLASGALAQGAAAQAGSTLEPVLALLARLIHADRWSLWMGVLLVLSVYYFPTGIVGRLRGRAAS